MSHLFEDVFENVSFVVGFDNCTLKIFYLPLLNLVVTLELENLVSVLIDFPDGGLDHLMDQFPHSCFEVKPVNLQRLA